MIELRSLKPEAIPSALEMAKRYRLLNEPDDAESICLDILAVDPGHQEALITRLLALTDKFAGGALSGQPAAHRTDGFQRYQHAILHWTDQHARLFHPHYSGPDELRGSVRDLQSHRRRGLDRAPIGPAVQMSL